MSSLSIDKLRHFATNNGFQVQRIFTKHNEVFVVELMSTNTIDYVLLFIPDKYKFQLPPDIQTFALSEVSMNDTKTDDVEDYVHVSESFIDKTYSDNSSVFTIPTHKRTLSMSEHLDGSYKKNVIIQDINGNDGVVVKNLHRQLRRLKYCIKGMPHKLALLKSPFIGVLSPQDEIHVFTCDALKRSSDQKLFIVIDFQIFYDRIHTVEQECSQIFKGIYNVLNGNQEMHSKNIKHILDRKDNILAQSEFLQTSKHQYAEYMNQYLTLLEELLLLEKSKEHNLTQVRILAQESVNLHHDMKRSHQKKKLENELQQMNKTKGDLVKVIQDVKCKNENLILKIDSILFDNIVMLDKIFKNFEELNKLEAELKS